MVQTNKLGDISFATPSIVNNKIYTRVGVRTDSKVQEWLFCLSESKGESAAKEGSDSKPSE